MKLILVFLLALSINGCVSDKKSTNSGRYKLQHDKAPTKGEKQPNLSQIPNAKPKVEPRSKIGNPRTYQVFNKTYKVLPHSRDFKEQGKASWYGKKFHGYKTSNGETYDMYAMTAAHKTLPIPTYLKVRNMKNGKEVIVKVNDRGPFHEDRIIDLSYAAAAKLGMLQHGTTDVEIIAITSPTSIDENYLQVGAFMEHAYAKILADKLRKHTKEHKITIRKQALYHVHIGPIYDETVMSDLKKLLIAHDFPEPIEVTLGSIAK